MMDAREKWIEAAEKLAEQMVLLDSCSAMSVGNGDNKYEEEFIDKRAQLFAHLRTTPEGFALVPVPEWVPVGERLPVVPEGKEYVDVWAVVDGKVKEDAYGPQIVEDKFGDLVPGENGFCSCQVTHWQYAHTPAPPKSEPL